MAEDLIKVFIATDGIFPHNVGGIQRHSRLLVEHLATHPGFIFYVLHPHKGQQLFPAFKNVQEITVDDIDTGIPYIKACRAYSSRVMHEIEQVNPDIVYAQGVTVWDKIETVAGKLIVNPHGLESFQPIGLKAKLVGLLFRRFQVKTFKHARFVVTEGGHLTRYLKKYIPAEKIVFFPNATSLPAVSVNRRYENGGKIRCFFLARFASNKGIHILFDAVDKLNKAGYADKIEFVLGGKGPLWEHYRQNNPHPNVTLLGFIPDDELGGHFEKSDVFIFPTLFEGMPTVILEAMSHRLPIIASDVGGIPELVDDANGFLIRKNSADALQRALMDFYDLPAAKKQAMGEVSYQRIANSFNWPHIAGRHIELFLQMAGKPAK